jgi:hypothetical protein
MRRRGIIVGCVLGFVGGVLIGSGWAWRDVTLWLPGVLTAGLAVLLLVYFVRRSPLAQLPRPRAGQDLSAAPPLGQMLVAYGLISETQLEVALERQSRTKRRLGRILVDMKLVSFREVADVLEEQWSRRHHTGPAVGAGRPATTDASEAEAGSESRKPEVIVRPDP